LGEGWERRDGGRERRETEREFERLFLTHAHFPTPQDILTASPSNMNVMLGMYMRNLNQSALTVDMCINYCAETHHAYAGLWYYYTPTVRFEW
jgi:hypothetical protein